jgi:hypothetical protein
MSTLAEQIAQIDARMKALRATVLNESKNARDRMIAQDEYARLTREREKLIRVDLYKPAAASSKKPVVGERRRHA